ncbi:hypothetical protein T484DRAFT_1807578 [Baffinella frigidus]|nr:hypothetical protein T484DRAFT_1807578 [Cryptophyta sp. CCMP2293]
MAIQPGGQGRRRLLLVVVGCTAALALLAATRPAGAPAELQQRGRRGRGGAFTLAAQKIARAAAILRCVRTQGLSGGCPMAKVQGGAASGFEVPEYTEGGQQWNENSAGWTAAGVLDNAPGGYATVDPWHEHSKAGGVKETYGEPVPAGSVANRGGVGTSCGCAVPTLNPQQL